MSYELVWTEHADLAGSYESRSAAEGDLRAYALDHPEHADALALIEVDERGRQVGEAVSGADLLARSAAA